MTYDEAMIGMAMSEAKRTGLNVFWNGRNSSFAYTDAEGLIDVEVRKKFDKMFFVPINTDESGRKCYGEREELITIKSDKGIIDLDVWTKMPDTLRDLVNYWQYDREDFGIDGIKEKYLLKGEIER